MHIPDGSLSSGAVSSLIGAALGAVVFAFSKIRQTFFVKEKAAVLKTPEGIEFGGGFVTKLTQTGKGKIFKMLALGLFIFAAQLFDFANIQGLSVHFLGGTLAAIMLGPLEGFLAISAVLAIQCLALGDGGLTALGANIFNMGVIGTIGSGYLYKFFLKTHKNVSSAAGGAAFLSILVVVIFYSGELFLSGYGKLSFGQVISIGLLAGLVEGVLTLLFLRLFRYREND